MKKKVYGMVVLTLALMIAGGTRKATAQSIGDPDAANTIVGAWNSTVTFVDCTTGAVIRTFPTMNTFNMGGTMSETSRSLATRSPGHGTWERIRGNVYRSVFKFFRSNADGTDNGYQLVYRWHELSDGTINTTATFQNYNAAGIPTTSGCAVESATRLE